MARFVCTTIVIYQCKNKYMSVYEEPWCICDVIYFKFNEIDVYAINSHQTCNYLI